MNQAMEILNSNKEYFDTLIEIQQVILEEESSYEDIISLITKSNILSNKELLLHFLQTIKKCVYIRPHKIDLLVSVLSYLKDKIHEFPKLRWLGKHIPNQFINELRRIGLFKLPIVRLQNRDEKEYKNIIDIIKSDDISSFQQLLSQTNFDINTKININFYKLDNTYNTSLIELSCLFGSLQIFKFLMMNNATRWKMLPNYACAGGNYEIVHILERENIKFDNVEVIAESIKFHRNDIVEYLEPSPFEIFKYCVKYDNIQCFVNCLEKICSDKFNQLEFDDYFIKVCFHSVKKNYSEITKILCFLYPECVNQQDFSKQCMIHRALQNNYFEIAKFLCNFEKSDLNIVNNEVETPLFIAVRAKNAEIVQMLCDNEKVDLNIQNNFGNTALHIALENQSIDLIKIFINHKNRLNTGIKNNQHLMYINLAIMTKNLEIVKLINELCSPGNEINSDLLGFAESNGTPEIVDFLKSLEK